MNYLLDTNLVSEWTKPLPDPGVMAWLDEVDEDRTFLSVLTLGEIRRGIERMAAGRKREQLSFWLENDLADRFNGRILEITAPIAGEWGRLLAEAEKSGHTLHAVDGLLAATARVRELTLVTRNTRHFSVAGASLFNPWSA